jgi:ring-1,2-phenylacetyl-CoA epoxidase subunit PaaC
VSAVWRDPPPVAVSPAAAADLLALADDELMMGHRHGEWLGLSPFLEEDLTTASIAQDEIGHARALHALLWPDWADRDAGVVRRPPWAWRSAPLAEIEGSPWERALLRHWLHDLVEPVRWQGVVAAHAGEIPALPDLAARVAAEERFHRAHAGALVTRLASVPAARERLTGPLDVLLELLAVTLGRLPGPVAAAAVAEVRVALADVGFTGATVVVGPPGDPAVRHPEAASALTQLLDVFAFDPEARW